MSEAREEALGEGTDASDAETETSEPAPSPRSGSGADTLCGAASLLLPLALYAWTAAASPTWLDSAEFLATGFALGAAHPPGHFLLCDTESIDQLLIADCLFQWPKVLPLQETIR